MTRETSRVAPGPRRLAPAARLDHLPESVPRDTNRRVAAAYRERSVMRCSRCGHQAADTDKFCAECGLFLRDAFIDHRLLHALVPESEGRHREARRELERLVETAPDNAIANHLLGHLLVIPETRSCHLLFNFRNPGLLGSAVKDCLAA